jgi:hypothetical protein
MKLCSIEESGTKLPVTDIKSGPRGEHVQRSVFLNCCFGAWARNEIGRSRGLDIREYSAYPSASTTTTRSD